MKKILSLILLVAVVSVFAVSCSLLGAIAGSAETQNVPYIMEETDDIYGHHVRTGVLVDKQTEGLSASDFNTRFVKDTLNDEVVSYGIVFREQDYLTNDGYYYMSLFPLLKVDGQIFEFPLESLPDYMWAGDIRFKEVEVTLPAEAVEALRNAESVVVQLYEVNDVPKVVEIDAEGIAAIKDLLK